MQKKDENMIYVFIEADKCVSFDLSKKQALEISELLRKAVKE